MTVAARTPVPPTAVALHWHRRIYDAAAQHVEAHGYPPAIRELQRAVGYRSPSSMLVRLAEMRTAGNVTWQDGKPRTLVLLRRP